MATQPAENADNQTPVEPPIATIAASIPAKAAGGLLQAAAKRHADLAELLARATATESGASRALDPDLVHDLRVATRRLEEAAGIVAAQMDKLMARVVADSLKTLRRAAGDLRDLDVACEHLTAGGKWRMPKLVKTAAFELVGELRSRREELEGKLREQAASGSVAGAMVLLARAIEEHSTADKSPEAETTLAKELKRKRERREKQVRRAFGKAALKQTADSLHEARIAAKKLRYTLELTAASGAGQQKKRLAFLKRIQKLLGDHHDVHVVEAMVGQRVSEKARALKGLSAEWRKWQRSREREQAQRAAEFFTRSYAWMNEE